MGDDAMTMMTDFASLPPPQSLLLHAQLADELRARGILRSANNPAGDLAEYLFCKAFGWTPAGNSSPNVDAVAGDGMRYQIKGRRITRPALRLPSRRPVHRALRDYACRNHPLRGRRAAGQIHETSINSSCMMT
jgi:hypothetical protein